MRFIHRLAKIPNSNKEITVLTSQEIGERSRLFRVLNSKIITESKDFDILLKLAQPCLFQRESSSEQIADCIIENATCFYFQYHNDNKYFIGSESHEYVFHDSHAYMAFYRQKGWDLKSYNYHNEMGGSRVFNLVCREQYGHFLYDDILPLFSYLYRNSITNFSLDVYFSKQWHLDTASTLIYLFGFNVKMTHYRCIGEGHKFTMKGKVLVSSHPNCAVNWNVMLPWHQEKNVSPARSIIYLSRIAFDQNMQRITNRDEIREICSKYSVKVVSPELYDLKSLVSILSLARVIVADPGTTPLIAGLFSNHDCPVIVLQSIRTVTDCNIDFAYSGWKYHLPWADRFHYVFCDSQSSSLNPFSDFIRVPVDRLESLLDMITVS